MKTRLCLLALLLVSLTSSLLGQGVKRPRTEADYTPRTLKELSTLVPEIIANNPDYKKEERLAVLYHGDMLPSRVKAQYEGTTRPLDDRKKMMVKQWADQYAGMPEFYTSPYDTEVVFTEGGARYWLAVRKESFPALTQESKTGAAVELFVIKLGNVRMNPADENMEAVMLVEKFVKQ